MSNSTYMSKITLPVNVNGTIQNVEFTIKDAEARQAIQALGNALYWIGVTTTALSEGATTNPITVNNESVTARLGGLAAYEGMEYAWNGSAWQGIGPANLGALAYADTASGSYTPAGTVAISKGSDTTDSVVGVTANGTLPYFTQNGETVIFNAGALPTLDSSKTFVAQRGNDTAAFSGTAATITVEPDHPSPEPEDSINVTCLATCKPKAKLASAVTNTATWVDKSWNLGNNMNGYSVWTDGEHLYASSYNGSTYTHYVFNESTGNWDVKTWNGLTNFDGSDVWTDGTNIYFSKYDYTYTHGVLDKATGTWSAKTWTGYSGFCADDLWTDGTDIYCSWDMKLNKTTGEWEAATWTGIDEDHHSYIEGRAIWTDGDNLYLSYGDVNYTIDTSTGVWTPKTWNGLTGDAIYYINGYNIWTDGTDIYMNCNGYSYVLDKATSTWSAKTWTGLSNFEGQYVWTDGENIYYSVGDDSIHKVLT